MARRKTQPPNPADPAAPSSPKPRAKAASTPKARAKAGPTRDRPPGRAFQIKITLLYVEPPIWRRVVVPDCSLDELHSVIQVAMGWQDDHLYEFSRGRSRATTVRYSPSETPFGDPLDPGDDEPAEEFALGDLARRAGAKLRYLYDLGDSWMHEVRVERILPESEAKPYPVCLEGERACPPEDCGGPRRYEAMLETLAGPDSPERRHILDWCGKLKLESFSPARANKIFSGWTRE